MIVIKGDLNITFDNYEGVEQGKVLGFKPTDVSDEYRGGIPFVTKWCKMDPNKAEYLPGYLPICQCYDGPSLVHIYS